MRAIFSCVLFLMFSLLLACSEETVAPTQARAVEIPEQPAVTSPQRPAADQISEAEAAARKARVSDISYILDIDLISLADAYTGEVRARFDLSDAADSLAIDFTGGSVQSIVANGSSIAVDYNGFFITLPPSALQVGSNDIVIHYTHPFDQDGTGLHRFVDPEDGRTYLYTYLWPYYSNRLFPNFDQPDLKATYELTVRAEKDWQVVSSITEDSVTEEAESKLWHFPTSEKFSSYIFSLHAGPYHVWEDQAGDVPIRLMARQSLADYVAVEEWLTYTKAGLEHYRDYFDIPYPFKKYDQVIVPDFLIGAMENVAAVTFSESYVDRGSYNRFNSQRRAGTILHEMAHMWFGDLVTMSWWNGLWLNESFATLMSSIAVFEVTEFEDMWHGFYLSENLTAINADNRVSTHPIEVPVNSSNDFFNVFDAITYDKGASVLNQLSHYIGRENFRLGVSNYLKEHAWGNTELADFMAALSTQAGTDLGPWAQDWMYQAGVNTIEARVSCSDGSIESFAILQSAPADHPTIRAQRVQLGLFSSAADGVLENYAAIPVEVMGVETQVPEAIGLDCPDLTLPNYDGWGYTQISLDPVSMNTAINDTGLQNIADPLARSMIWSALVDAPTQGQVENSALLTALIESLALESNDRIVRQVLGELVSNLNRLEKLGAGFAAELASFGPLAEQRLWALIVRGVVDSPAASVSGQTEGMLLQRLRSYIDLARSSEALDNLAGLLGNSEIPGLGIGQGLRWTILQRLAERDYGNVEELMTQERQRDGSDAGVRAFYSVQAALPDLAIKEQWVERILDLDDPLPLSNQRAAMSAIFPAGQEELQLALLPRLVENLPALAQAKDNYYLQSYGRDMFAGICSEEGLRMLSQAIVDSERIGPTLYRFMSENRQSAQECVSRRSL